MKRLIAAVAALCFLLTGCSPIPQKGDKPLIVCTLFPTYDFAREIAGDKAEVVLLLPPGVESHSYEPAPGDIIRLNEADMLVYTGDGMEPWIANIRESLAKSVRLLDASAGIGLSGEHAPHGHDHDEEEEEEEYGDPHIWTDPVLARKMAENIYRGIIEADPKNSDYYAARFAAYDAELCALDSAFSEFFSGVKNKTVFFGGRFALYYFARRYGLDCVSAYDSCSEETEPSLRAVTDMIDKIRLLSASAVYYEELASPAVALTIAQETDIKALLLHSCHNVSKSELESGTSYLALMYNNLKNLREGLN